MGGVMYQFSKTHNAMRIPYHSEPPLFSALKGRIKVSPGLTLKASPYFTLENLMDGLNFQFRYTYLRHMSDTLKDLRECKSALSYLESCIPRTDEKTFDSSKDVRCARKKLSRWVSHYLTFEVMYDTVEAMKDWWLQPKIYGIFDYAFSGRGMCKTHQFTLGVELHF
jgi:hypothetical protein